jgi:RES domain-containing protein
MLSAWRIVNARHTKEAFTGEGARQHRGRWNSRGVPLVYLAEYRSLAVLEIVANARANSVHEEYALIEASWDESLMERLPDRDLPVHWRALPPRAETRVIGNRWLQDARSLVLAVPNVIIPAETNYLLNPAHPDFRRIRIGKPTPFVFDPRLLRL